LPRWKRESTVALRATRHADRRWLAEESSA
jgi:hypothetical protein